MAKNNQINVSVGVDGKGYEKGWDNIVKTTVEAGKSVEKEARKAQQGIEKALAKVDTAGSIRGAMMASKAAIYQMEKAGQANTKAFRDAVKEAAMLKDQMGDMDGLIAAMNPEAPFNALAKSVQLGAQAFAGAQGAMAMFGAESEETQKVLLKVQSAMAMAEGAKAIGGAKDAMKELNMAMAENPAMFIAVGIVAVIAAAKAFNEIYMKTVDVTDQVTAATEKSIISTKKERLELDTLWKVANDETASKEARLNAIQKLNEEFPSFHKNLTLETLKTNEATTAHRRATEAILAKAKAAAVSEMITDLYKKEVEAVNDLTEGNVDYFSLLLSGGNAASYLNLEAKKVAGYVKQREALEALYTSITKVQLAEQQITPTTTTPSPKVGNQTTTKKTVQKTEFVATKAQGIKQVSTAIQEQTNLLENNAFVVDKNSEAYIRFQKTLNDVELDAAAVNDALNRLTSDSISNMANAMGTAIITGENFGKAIGDSFLTSIADFLQTMGKMMITTASTWAAFESLLVSNPVLAIGAGVAAVAAGAALKAVVSQGAKPKAFATGGMVNSPTFAMIGDNLNSHNNPEFVLRQDQLGKMLNNNGSGNMNLSTTVRGQDLIILLENANRQKYR